MKSSKITKELLKDFRGELASISIESVPYTQDKDRATNSQIYYRDYFEKELDRLIKEQLLYIALNADSLEALYFARGTINGFYIIKEFFKREIDEVAELVEETE